MGVIASRRSILIVGSVIYVLHNLVALGLQTVGIGAGNKAQILKDT